MSEQIIFLFALFVVLLSYSFVYAKRVALTLTWMGYLYISNRFLCYLCQCLFLQYLLKTYAVRDLHSVS